MKENIRTVLREMMHQPATVDYVVGYIVGIVVGIFIGGLLFGGGA